MNLSRVRTRSQQAVRPERAREESTLTTEENYEIVRQEEAGLIASIQNLKDYWKKLRGSHREALRNGRTECDFPSWVLQNVSHDLIPIMLDIEYGKNTRAINFYGPNLEKHYGVPQWQFILFFGKLSQPKVKSLNNISKNRQDLRNFESLYNELKRIRSERVPFSHGPQTFEKVDFDTCADIDASHDDDFQNENDSNDTSHEDSYHTNPQSISDDDGDDDGDDDDNDDDDDGDDDDDDWDYERGDKGKSSVIPIRECPQRESSNRSSNSILVPGPNDLEDVMVFDWANPEDLPDSGEQEREAPDIPEAPEAGWLPDEDLRTDTTTVSAGEIQGNDTQLTEALVSSSPSFSFDRLLIWTRKDTGIFRKQNSNLERMMKETWEHLSAELQKDYENSSSLEARSSTSPDLSVLYQKYEASKKNLREHNAKRLKWNESCTKLIQGLQEQIDLNPYARGPHTESQE